MAAHARSLLLRIGRLPCHNVYRHTSSQELIDAGVFSSSSAFWNAQFYSSAPAKMQMEQRKGATNSSAPAKMKMEQRKTALAAPKSEPDPDSKRSKRLKTLARILGQDDQDLASLNPDEFLLKVLKKEYKKADKSIEKYKVDIKGSFDPFEIVPTEGTSQLTLRRKTEDEEIIVNCLLELEEPDDEEYLMEDDEHELNILPNLKMNIEIRKTSMGDGARFQLFCHYLTESITIEEIVYLDKSAYVENDYPYAGPFFGDLNAQMKQSFYDLIKNRGIDAHLADLALDHLTRKYQEEYLNWLRNIRGFLKRKGLKD
ncbi:hypothetical protein GOP47_0018859 [Adiantum capillus-veneris]|uniref:Mitochondrial glycoprotein n=1 Tax=Adiantum capillus-veneris TaxID=13818 RepID=A0A9D4ZA16_ADICA|nr:hypothetical protein GOP47_0018859 [Adiantum capillus-veneris]